MFDRALLKLGQRLGEVTSIAEWNERLRETIFASSGTQPPIVITEESLVQLKTVAPERLAWRIFDHYASLGQIYAVFELAITDLVEEYVTVLPVVTPNYSALSDSVRTSHRVGVGQVLMKWNEALPAYRNVSERAIASGLADGLRGQDYSLLCSAFLTDSDNYRPDTLNRVFKKIGFEDAFSAVKKDQEVIDFCNTQLEGDSAESYLIKFVQERNEAAHGEVSEIATVHQIKNYAHFAKLVVHVFARLLQSSAVKAGLNTGKSRQIGTVVRVFSHGVCGVRACVPDHEMTIGQRILVGAKNLNFREVKSLRLVEDDLAAIALVDGLEFGLGLGAATRVGDALYITTL
jgi:hypothetical protein